ncbi:hypothetical protein L1887_51891 [Cichorium endivia]|nr:hypothetical protein L1887_51891 [Cichorium endivia]
MVHPSRADSHKGRASRLARGAFAMRLRHGRVARAAVGTASCPTRILLDRLHVRGIQRNLLRERQRHHRRRISLAHVCARDTASARPLHRDRVHRASPRPKDSCAPQRQNANGSATWLASEIAALATVVRPLMRAVQPCIANRHGLRSPRWSRAYQPLREHGIGAKESARPNRARRDRQC